MFVPEGYILLLAAIGEIAAGIDAEAMKARKPEAVQRAEDASALVSRYLWLRACLSQFFIVKRPELALD
jgi:hypothetical protein